ncbi:PP2C family protein-serine/threonine phosphatase [Marichromatium bheemlicum]|uniref:Serine/threonine-protein phosphatase n=1 Tax=Marichromatium bheemlicum TaxID=365339 RepID=A0ABX1I5A3_9GAMM|nr:protein phosphatase 2C domain-containing protein [Marichromatium bheemlicum]NKN32348.1 serine/threonine-protein phosphatase [Marichromatium bheemlicum]
MWSHQLDYAWRTDRGRVRAHNEDAVGVHPALGLIMVADGVGGASAGEVASRTAVETIAERFRRHPSPRHDAERARVLLEAAVEEANVAIWRHANATPGCAGMGTTVVVGLLGPGWMVLAHVGDSRVYRLRDGALEQLSRDHSLLQEVLDQGLYPSREEAMACGIGENILTRALGSLPSPGVSSRVHRLAPGDLYLFCSDGLSGMLDDIELRALLLEASPSCLGQTADALVEAANAAGGKDNVSLALLHIGPRLVPEPEVCALE